MALSKLAVALRDEAPYVRGCAVRAIGELASLEDEVAARARELKPEIDAYRDFVKYREAEAKRLNRDPDELNRGDYLKAREKELLSRMRRRRRGGHSRSGGKSPFSLF